IYGVYEWVVTAKTSTMPSTAYLVVSKSPYLFLISVVAICLALILEVRSANLPERTGVVQANTTRLQILAVVVLIVSFLAALSTASYDFGTAFSFFVNGRYALIYAFFLIGISLLLSPKQVLGNIRLASIPDVLGLLLIVVSPVLFYGGLKVHLGFTASSIGALLVAIIGFVLLIAGSGLFGKKKQKPATTPQVTPTAPSQQK
ncbi:MAG TPA: hypothetical protein VN739_05895, partial [Nitrososphaerales archaeon]|nr:hypothetical protein [Nitrososphaerales archaeon]